MELPKFSEEQFNIILQLNNNNVVVDSVAGCGKTTCSLHIAKYFLNLNMLLLTYNSKLKIETRDKVKKLKLNNLETHSYHSFCVKNYEEKCHTDTTIIKILKNNIKSRNKYKYDIIILDEAQDITPLYFELICKIYKDNNKEAKICILGDRNQSIYDFNRADERFIIYAEQLFNFNKLFWTKCQLSQSFRITFEMAEFINNCMLDHDRIKSNKITNIQPRYIICDCFGKKMGTSSRTFREVKYYLDIGYLPEDIFILAPSLKSEGSPVRQLENKIKTTLKNIPIYVPTSDEEKLDAEVLKNKMVFSTFHQVKGQERKVVIVFNFDNSYFKFYKKNKSPKICPNELYVASTRALECLTLFHHYTNDYLPFLNRKNLYIYAKIEFNSNLQIFNSNKDKNINTAVTDLIKHLPQEILDKCMSYLKITNIQKNKKKINIPIKTKQKHGFENVSEITGTAIPAYFEYKLKDKMDIFNRISENIISKNTTRYNNICLFKDIDNENDEDENINIDYKIENIKLETLNEDELLYISNRWCAYSSGYIHKIYQIDNYNWLSKENLEKCIKILQGLNISKLAEFEKKCERENEDELLNRKISGYFDCIDNNNIYEFKCVDQLSKEHYLQLAIYKYLYELEKIKLFEKKENDILKLSLENIIHGDILIYKIEDNKNSGSVTAIFKNGNINIKNEEMKRIYKITKNNIIKNISYMEKNNIGILEKTNYYLYNILTDELNMIECDIENLKKMIQFLIYSKYINSTEITDDMFISKIYNISKNYY